MEEIKKSFLVSKLKEYKESKVNTIIRHGLCSNSLQTFAKSQDRAQEIDYKFSLDVDTMKVTNQKQSGRCWIFSATNVLREIIGKKLNIEKFELSQSYIALYDKFEKINYELESIISLIGCANDDRTLNQVLNNTIGDGGQWDMFVAVVSKYGVVPKSQFIETFQSSSTSELNHLIKTELNKFASRVNEIYKIGGMEQVRKDKEELLSKFYTLLLNAYGVPCEKFDFEYVDKDKVYHIEKDMTPLSFYEKYLKEEVESYVSLINAPTSDKIYMKSYTISYLGNVVGGREVKHLNISMDRMIELILLQLKDKKIVWFGSDVSFYRNREKENYVWDDKSYDYTTPYGLNYECDKGKALEYGISAMNHAMCITGVCLNEDNKPIRWKIENSWGKDVGKDGYFLMSDTWFNKYVYQAVIDKQYLTADEIKAYDGKPVVLKPWDPMGSLAD